MARHTASRMAMERYNLLPDNGLRTRRCALDGDGVCHDFRESTQPGNETRCVS
jgi:hypothetical protein